jgi:hypothetical protein
MPLFGRKKEVNEIQEIKKAIEQPPETEEHSDVIEMLRRSIESPIQRPIEPMEKTIPPLQIEEFSKKLPEPAAEEQKERPSFAPLFVKLDKYKQILNSLVELKTTIAVIKNAFAVLNELERLKLENLKMIESSIEKMDKKLVSLDSEFLRPSGFHEDIPAQMYSPENFEAILNDLRNQIGQLRSEIQT